MKEKTGRAQTSIKPSGSYVGNPGPDAGIKPRAKSDRPIDGFNDHGTHEAIYLRDSEENGLELCWDRPPEEWARDAEGHLTFANRRLDLAGLLRAGLDEESAR